jgi:hypothetical protein
VTRAVAMTPRKKAAGIRGKKIHWSVDDLNVRGAM